MTAVSTSRSRVRPVLVCTVITVGALALGLAAGGATLAALSASATVPGATISAGSLGLTVNGASSAPLAAFSVVPGAPQAQAFTVTNTGTAAADLTATINVSSSQPIKDNMRARLTAVGSAAQCVPGLGGPLAPLVGYVSPVLTTVAAGQSASLCLEVTLDDATPPAQAGQSAAFTATISATQKGR